MSTILPLLDGQNLGTHRNNSNTNFESLNNDKSEIDDVIIKGGSIPYVPTDDNDPTPKKYVDDAIDGVDTDLALQRSNHIGVQPASTITQDANNRFVTDTQKTEWSGKESAIGTKGDAFNKFFGTGVDDIPHGNHTHTKNDIGLGNANNTADANKPVSISQAAAIALKEPVISPKNDGFNKSIGVSSGTIAKGDHGHKIGAMSGGGISGSTIGTGNINVLGYTDSVSTDLVSVNTSTGVVSFTSGAGIYKTSISMMMTFDAVGSETTLYVSLWDANNSEYAIEDMSVPISSGDSKCVFSVLKYFNGSASGTFNLLLKSDSAATLTSVVFNEAILNMEACVI